MRLKSIKPTDGLKQIEFGELKPAWDGHAAGGAKPMQEVLGPGGWTPVERFDKIKTGPTVIVRHRGGELVCDPHHRLLRSDGRWTFVSDLPAVGSGTAHYLKMASSPADFGQFTNAYTVEPGPVRDLYDVQVPAPHAYYTSGLVSHNSIMLCNNAMNQIKYGRDTLLITFELSTIRTAMRCLGALTAIPQNNFVDHKQHATDIAKRTFETNKAQLCIWELPPDECSVEHIYGIIAQLKRSRGWRPKVVVIDYMDLMIGRRQSDNKDDYSRLKHVSTQIRGLARNEQVVVYTATQTNRSGNNTEELIDLNKIAESYGKAMSLDYIISLNQTPVQHAMTPPRVCMYIAKNRNGPKQVTIECTVNYSNMQLLEAPL